MLPTFDALALRDSALAKLEGVVGGEATGVGIAVSGIGSNDMPVTFPEIDPARIQIASLRLSRELI
jgi:hypothetical protein